jgi:DTW domain-containing protein YfiP
MSRETCQQCARIQRLCLCSRVTPFEIEPRIILLVHPREYSRTTGTARIVNQSIRHSRIFRGYGEEFDHDPRLRSVLEDPHLRVVLLYPGPDSLNLSECSDETLRSRIPDDGKRLVVLIVDGTWSSAKRMIRTSAVLSRVPKISFQVESPSRFRFKRQPREFCLSTVEATALLLENLTCRGLCTLQPPNAHWRMLEPFEKLVETQLRFISSLSKAKSPLYP